MNQQTFPSHKCKYCNAVNHLNAIFCTKCGKKIVINAQIQSRSNKLHKMRKETKIAFISAISTILAAIITAILGPFLLAKVSFSWKPTPLTKTPLSLATYPPSNWKLIHDDSMQRNNSIWSESTDKYGNCRFAENIYQVNVVKNAGWQSCSAMNSDYINFAFETQMTIVSGDYGGVFFRYNSDAMSGYSFIITTNGIWRFNYSYNYFNYSSELAGSRNDPSIHTGLNQPNTIAIVAQENTFHFYVNNEQIISSPITDPGSTFGHGDISLVAGLFSGSSGPARIQYSSTKIWIPNS